MPSFRRQQALIKHLLGTGPCPPCCPLPWMVKVWGLADCIYGNLSRLPDLTLPILACLSAVPLLQNLLLTAGHPGHGRGEGDRDREVWLQQD